MTTMKKSIHDNANGLDYTLVNDHYLPNLTAAAPAEHPTGRWGRLHKTYLKEQHPIRYNQLLLSGVLGSYLAKLDKQAEEQLALTIRQMQEAEGVTEALKAADQLEWVRRINESAKLFERITDPALTVRRITINANKVTPDEGIYQVDFFTDTKKLEKEKKLQQAMLGIKNKYGKNAVLKASSYEEGATMRQRNAQIGGHSAGGSDGKLQK